MTLQDSSGSGLDGAGSRLAVLVVALLAVDAAWNLVLNTLLARSGLAATMQVAYDLTLPLTLLGSVGGLLAASVAGVAVLAAMVRVFAPDTDALGGGETPIETVFAYGRAVVVGLVGVVAVVVGLAALVVPGLAVLVHLPLVFVAVATDGVSIATAVDRSWTRTRGNRARVAAVGLAVVSIPLALAVVATLTALLSPAAELAVGVVVTAAAATAGVAAFTRIADSLDDASTGSSRTDRVNPTAPGRL
jgi:hypothetical protein